MSVSAMKLTSFAAAFILMIKTATSLKNVELTVYSKNSYNEVVCSGSTVILSCFYHLEAGETVDSINWYKGKTNIFKYDAYEDIFQNKYDRDIDMTISNRRQVSVHLYYNFCTKKIENLWVER